MPLQTSGARRSLAIAGLPVRAVGRATGVGVARVLRRGDPAAAAARARSATAADTRAVLGTLKGGALKVGQLLSTVDALFPADPEGSWQHALRALQEDNPGLPFEEVRPVLEAELGPRWSDRLGDLDERPAAAASLGQVHRGTWADGTPVAVKVQYPGVAEAVSADVRALALALRATSVVARGLAMPPLVAELRTRLGEELDYVLEGEHQQRFAAHYGQDDPEIVVPPVLLATRRVLVTRWLDGTPLAVVGDRGSAAQRDTAGALYQRFFLTSPARVGLLHTDPHPGNVRVLPDGRLGILDFGSVLEVPDGLPPSFGGLIGAMVATDPDEVQRRLRSGGFVAPGARIDVAALIDYLSPFSEPARHEVFTYSRSWLRGQFGRVNDPRNPDFAVALQLTIPAELLFTHRLWLGVVGVLCGLGATVPVRPELIAYLPGFAQSAGAAAPPRRSPEPPRQPPR